MPASLIRLSRLLPALHPEGPGVLDIQKWDFFPGILARGCHDSGKAKKTQSNNP
jgi:hypothetical protein